MRCHSLHQAQADYVLADTRLRAGDWLLLSCLSASHDDAVFEQPLGTTPVG